MAIGFGGWRLTFAEVKPGTLMKPLSMAERKVEMAGEPNVACQKFTKSATESNRTAAEAEVELLIEDAVDSDLRSTIHSPVLTSRFP